jgi:dCTP deaminase
MILTDREIRVALQQRQVIVEPQPDLNIAITSTAMDLTLSDRFMEWDSLGGMQICPGRVGYKYADLAKKFQKQHTGEYKLKPQHFVLAWTKEKINIPFTSRLAARVEGKSSLARLGLGIHVTAPTIHSGFKGNIQLEMFNLGPHEIILDPGMWICQLIFETTIGTPDKGYDGLFVDQTDQSMAGK